MFNGECNILIDSIAKDTKKILGGSWLEGGSGILGALGTKIQNKNKSI